MLRMTSSEFRKRYATLTESTEVTANGHIIGVWQVPSRWQTIQEIREQADRVADELTASRQRSVTHPFAEFRPVPKPSSKGK